MSCDPSCVGVRRPCLSSGFSAPAAGRLGLNSNHGGLPGGGGVAGGAGLGAGPSSKGTAALGRRAISAAAAACAAPVVALCDMAEDPAVWWPLVRLEDPTLSAVSEQGRFRMSAANLSHGHHDGLRSAQSQLPHHMLRQLHTLIHSSSSISTALLGARSSPSPGGGAGFLPAGPTGVPGARAGAVQPGPVRAALVRGALPVGRAAGALPHGPRGIQARSAERQRAPPPTKAGQAPWAAKCVSCTAAPSQRSRAGGRPGAQRGHVMTGL